MAKARPKRRTVALQGLPQEPGGRRLNALHIRIILTASVTTLTRGGDHEGLEAHNLSCDGLRARSACWPELIWRDKDSKVHGAELRVTGYRKMGT
jgi:hypothetical protein